MSRAMAKFDAADYFVHRAEARKRRKASSKVRSAVKAGRLIELPCFICGCEKVEGHHPDYDQPLQVTWLCVEHHKQVHRESPRHSPPSPRRAASMPRSMPSPDRRRALG